ncbi:MAG: hypothetical protein ABSA05_05015 [Opitutaceae bacterium]|jgi:hypothetical protein
MEQERHSQITPEEARTSLAEIDQATRRIRQTIAAGISAPMLIMWGSIWAVSFVTEQYYPRWSQTVWGVLILIGSVVSIFAGFFHAPVKNARFSQVWGRIGLAWLILFAYAALWIRLLGPWEMAHRGYGALLERKVSAFICTVCMFAYVLMGLWLDRFLLYVGAAVTILTLVGYYYVPGHYYVWMAVTGGGSLIFAGLFIRKFWR